MKKCLSFILSIITSLTAIASCWNVSADNLKGTEEVFYENTTSEMEATNSFGKLLIDAIDENEEKFEGNGCYIINDLSFELSTGVISVDLNNVDYCNILVGFYSDDGTELITSVSQKLVPESDEAELYIDTSILPENFLIKAYLLDSNQLPMSDSYTCNTYTKAMQNLLEATIYDFDQDYVVNLDNEIDTNFFVLNSKTVMINSTDSENILLDADFENGIYTYLNPDQELSALNEGDIFYNQCGDSIVIDKVGTVQIAGDTITITSSGTDFQEVFDFIKIESDSSDLDILEMDESVEENAELISYEKKNSNNEEKNTRLFNPPLTKGNASFWNSFEFKFKLGEDKLYEKKSDDNEELKESESVKASGDVTFNLDPHINFYWNGSYFEANVEVVTKVTFNASLTGSYTGQICKFREIVLGANGISFKVSPVLEVSVSASIYVDAISTETFGLHYDSKNKFKSLQKAPEVTTNGINCTGTVKLYVNFQPKIVLITDKAANIKLDAKAGVKVTMKSNSIFSDFFGNNTEMHECDSCISGKICFFGELSITGSALNGKFSLTKDILSITIPITDYYVSSTFNEFGLTECPHYKYRLEFIVRDEQQKPASQATITLTKQQPKLLQLVGITEPIVDKITTNSDGIAEIWYPKSYSSNIPITINVSYNDYEPKEFEYQFTGKARKFNVNIYPVGYIEEKLADFVELLKGIDTSPVTTTSTTEPATITTTTTTAVSENIIASGECGVDGDNLTWTFDDNGTLLISGEGKMQDWSIDTNVPWYSCRSNINNVVINNGVTSIGWNAFRYCYNLVSINIPNSITDIGQGAFDICTKLTSIEIPDSVTIIRPFAFNGCSDLKSIKLPNNINGIYSFTFSGCSSLTSIEIPDGVTEIHIGAFTDCTNLKSITIPNSIKNIYDGAFSHGSNNLNDVYYTDSKEKWNEIEIGTDNGDLTKAAIHYNYGNETIASGECGADGDNLIWTFDNNGMLVISGKGKMEDWSTDLNVPWYSCRSNINNVIINNGVTSIGDYAFYYCSYLTSVTIPDSVTSIGNGAFDSCSGLTSVTIPDSVTSIGDHAFSHCSGLTSVTIPDSITSIGDCAFWSCSDLTSVTIPDSVTSIGHQAFDGCSGLTSVTLPDSVTSIGGLAFKGCSGLISVTIPDSVTSIVYGAFSYCSGLTSVTIPDSVTSIEDYAFADCSGLTSVTIPNSVTSIGESAFEHCESLTSITIPDSVTSIGDYAFICCSGLTSVTIPDSVTSIGNYAFSSCSGLTSVTIPDSVTSIGDYAFYCKNLADVYYIGTEEEWNSITIGSNNDYLTNAKIHYNPSAPTAQILSLPRNKTASVADDVKTYTYSNAVPDTEYLLMAVNNTETENILSADNLLYIDQQTADESGSVTFNYIAPDDCTYIFIGDFGKGEYCRVVSNAISTDTDQCTICNSTPDDDDPNHGNVTTTTSSITTTTTTTSSTTTTVTSTTTATYIETKYEDFTINKYSDHVEIGGYTGESTEVIIPAEIDELPVKNIGADAFKNCTSLGSITILNPECKIADSASTISNSLDEDNKKYVYSGVIKGYRGSTAEAYAKKYNRTFESIDLEFMLGDVTLDGIINGSDATLALRAYTLTSSSLDDGLNDIQFKAADVNGDGKITGSDATIILRYYTLLSSITDGETLPPMEEWIKNS